MSNLGDYQTMTTCAKKVGGPKMLVSIIFGCGVLGKMIFDKVRSKILSKVVIEVTSDGDYDADLSFSVGDSYRILFSDDEMVLIEKIGDSNNPYVVSPEFLKTISNYA